MARLAWLQQNDQHHDPTDALAMLSSPLWVLWEWLSFLRGYIIASTFTTAPLLTRAHTHTHTHTHRHTYTHEKDIA